MSLEGEGGGMEREKASVRRDGEEGWGGRRDGEGGGMEREEASVRRDGEGGGMGSGCVKLLLELLLFSPSPPFHSLPHPVPVLLSRSFFAAPVAYEGGNLTLTCVASQGSSISFTWAFGSAPLSNGGRVSIVALNSSASQLTVTQLSYTDAGTYQCTASLSAIVQSDTFSMPIVIQCRSPCGGGC